MNSWTGTRGRQFVALVLITAVLVLGSVFVAYADSTSRQPSAAMPARAQGDETPTATLSASTQGAEAAVVGSTEVPTPTLTPTFTPPPQPVCTPPPCQPGEVYYCPGECPGGCGTQCVRPTEQHPGGPTGVRNVIMNGGF